MSIVIEQNQEDVTQAFQVNQNVLLREIRLSEATLWSKAPEESLLTESLRTSLDFKPSSVHAADQNLRLCITFSFRIFREEAEHGTVDLVKVECQIEADYSVRPGHVLTDQQIKSFHEGNAVFTCWPFFREYVQNSTVRMNYPAPPIPLLRLMPKKEAVVSGQMKRHTKAKRKRVR